MLFSDVANPVYYFLFALAHVIKYKLLYLFCYSSKFYGILNTLKPIDIYSQVKIKGSTLL